MSWEMPYVRESRRCEICGRHSDDLERAVVVPGGKPKQLDRVAYVCDRHPIEAPIERTDALAVAARKYAKRHPQEERLFG